MDKVIFAAICDDVRREEDGRVSLIGIFDSIEVADFARSLPTIHVFARVGFEARGSHTVVIAVRSEDGEYSLELQRRVDASQEMEAESVYLVEIDWRLEGLRLPKPGRYRVYFVTDFVQEISGPCFMVRGSSPFAVASGRTRAVI